MMYRRGWLRLPKLDYARPDRAPGDPDFDRPQYRREDWAFLWMLLIIGCHRLRPRSGAAGLACRTAPEVWDTRWWSPVGRGDRARACARRAWRSRGGGAAAARHCGGFTA